MMDEHDHSARVHVWMETVAAGLQPERLVQVFEQGFAALWRRSHRTLGDVTLTAIADRVLYTAAERFPFLSSLQIEPTGLRCQELQAAASTLSLEPLTEGLQFVLVEFLVVLGNLTAEILTPALHTELSKIIPGEGTRS
jgi:hypothetical protein